jgi:gliding motility-associated lipoprotein GldH
MFCKGNEKVNRIDKVFKVKSKMSSFAKTWWMKFIIICILVSCLTACNQIELFEKNTPIPNLKWQNNFNATGVFNITDTNSLYDVFVVLRHTDAYAYNNIWLNVGLQSPGDSMKTQKINLTLGADAQGWEGVGMNDIWEVRKPIARLPLKKGDYKFSIAQIMRDNPLQHIMSVGLRLEKVK